MKHQKTRKVIKRKVITILHHHITEHQKSSYYSNKHVLVDNQTTSAVNYVKKILRKRNYHVRILQVLPEDISQLRHLRADLLFNLVDSKAMEIQIIKILERIRIPFTGSGLSGITNSNNKIRSKKIFNKYNIPSPSYSIILMSDRITRALLPSKFPVIIKPAFEHCSLGISHKSICKTYTEFKNVIHSLRKQFHQTLIAEQYIPGIEYHVTVLETQHETIALPLAEITYKKYDANSLNIYGFNEKWKSNSIEYKNCIISSPPKHIKQDIDTSIKKDAIKAFYAFGMKDYGRFDVRLNTSTNQWYFLEGNANAGFDPKPRDAMTAAIHAYHLTLEDFIVQIVHNSLPPKTIC